MCGHKVEFKNDKRKMRSLGRVRKHKPSYNANWVKNGASNGQSGGGDTSHHNNSRYHKYDRPQKSAEEIAAAYVSPRRHSSCLISRPL